MSKLLEISGNETLIGVTYVRGLLLWPGGKTALTITATISSRAGNPVVIHHKISERGMQKIVSGNKRESPRITLDGIIILAFQKMSFVSVSSFFPPHLSMR